MNAPGVTKPENQALPHVDHPDVTHLVVQALQQMEYDVSDPDRFLRALKNVDFGLTAESEFAAIAAWLGRCSLVHHLGQEQLTSPGQTSLFKVPDLLCIVDHLGKQQPLLIEVKTTKPSTKTSLRMKRTYLNSLRKYAATVGLPLLIAWRPRKMPFWVLFDPETTPYDTLNQRFNFEEVIKNDLMGVVFGDCYIVPRAGAGLRIDMEILRKTPTTEGYHAHLRVSSAGWHDSNGALLTRPARGVTASILATSEQETSEADGTLSTTFLSDGGATRSQSILRLLAASVLPDERRVHWRHVGRQLGTYISRKALLEDVEASFGICMQYIFHQHPTQWPVFLPEEWNRT